MLLTGPQQSSLATAMKNDPNNVGFAPNIASGNEAQLLVQVNQVVPGSSMTYTQLSRNAVLAAAIPINILLNQGVGAVGADGKTPITLAQWATAKAGIDYVTNLDPGSTLLFSTWNALGINYITLNFLTVAQATALGSGPGTTVQLATNVQTAVADIGDIQACLALLAAQGVSI